MIQLALEQQKDLELLKIHIDTLKFLLMQKSAILPIISSLSATMLIVATFNKELLPITNNIKFALIALLLLIPLSLIIALSEYYVAIKNTKEAINKIVKIDDFEYKTLWQKIYTRIFILYPVIGVFLLSVIIIYIAFSIW